MDRHADSLLTYRMRRDKAWVRASSQLTACPPPVSGDGVFLLQSFFPFLH